MAISDDFSIAVHCDIPHISGPPKYTLHEMYDFMVDTLSTPEELRRRQSERLALRLGMYVGGMCIYWRENLRD